MDVQLAPLVDSSLDRWWPVLSGILVTFMGGIGLIIVQRRWRREDEQEKANRAALEAELVGIAKRLDDETRRSICKDDDLGYDIQETRNALSHLCGTLSKPNPTYNPRRG